MDNTYESSSLEITAKRIEEYLKKEERKPERKETKKPLRKEKIAKALLITFFAFLTGVCLVGVYRLIKDFSGVNPGNLSFEIKECFLGVLGALCVAVSSAYEKFNYHKVKLYTYGLILTIFYLVIMRVSFVISLFVIRPLVLKIPVSEYVTEGMIVMLLKTFVAILSLLILIPTGIKYYGCFYGSEVKKRILEFRILNHVDLRKNRKRLYDVKAIRHMDNGSFYTIKEKDRFLHMMLDGPTGSGKTSLELVKVASDIDRKYKNTDETKKKLMKMVKNAA